MMIGLKSSRKFFASVQNNDVIANQSADWFGNPSPLHRPISEVSGCGNTDCHVASPRNDNAGQYSIIIIELCMLATSDLIFQTKGLKPWNKN